MDRHNSTAVQTDFPNIMVPQLQRKREREFLTAKPVSKFRKINFYFKNVSSIELNNSKILEDLHNMSLNDHEENINSQDVRDVIDPEFLDWPNIGTQWSRSQQKIYSTPVRTQNDSGINSGQTASNNDQGGQGQGQGQTHHHENSSPRNNLEVIQDLEKDLDEAIHRIRQEANKSNIFDVDINSMFNSTISKQPNVLSVQQHLNMNIFEPVKASWRQLRTLQTRKVQLTLRCQFYEKLLEVQAYPDWAMTFCLPLNLLNSEDSIEALVSFRQEQVNSNLRMLADLMYKEIERISSDITATMASLKVHYQTPAAQAYSMSDVTNSLATFMQRYLPLVDP